MDSILSVMVRDARHPCAPYESTGHSFFVQIFHCDGAPLFYKGVDFGTPVLLQVPGKRGGRIHGQFRVPPGCYVVRAVAPCNNVLTDWAMVSVGCGEKACVNLLPTSLRHCIFRMISGLTLGSAVGRQAGGEVKAANVAAKETEQALEALMIIADKLPEDPLPQPPKINVEEFERAVKVAEECESKEEEGQEK